MFIKQVSWYILYNKLDTDLKNQIDIIRAFTQKEINIGLNREISIEWI